MTQASDPNDGTGAAVIGETDTASDQQELLDTAIAADDRALAGRFARDTTGLVVLTFLASVVNYASNLVFSRMLSPASYGDLTALLALTVVIVIPSGAAQTVVAERVAALLAKREVPQVRYIIRHAVGHVGVIAVAIGLVYLACVPLVESALKLQAIGPALAVAPLIVLGFFVPLAAGVLQGMDRFAALGMVLLGIAISRIAFGVPWTLAGGGAGGPLFGQALGSAAAIVAMGWIAREYVMGGGTGAARSGLRRKPNQRTLAASGAFLCFAVLSNLDILLAKLLLDRHSSGLYAALVTVEKIVIFLPAAVAVVMVPNAARARVSGASAVRVLRIAALLVALTSVVVAVPAALEPKLVLQTMFGPHYTAAAAGVLPIVCAGTGLALLYLLVVYTVAIQDHRWVCLLVGGVVAQIGAILAFHSSAAEIARVQALVVAVLLLVNELLFHPLLRAERLVLGRS